MRKRSGPHTFVEFLTRRKQEIEAEAARLPEGPKRQALLLKIVEAENAAHVAGWLKADLHAPN